MSINKFILLILSSFFIVSCNTNAQEDKAYEVIDYVFEYLDNELKEKIKRHPNNKILIAKRKEKLSNPVYIKPVFSHLLTSRYSSSPGHRFPEIKNDFWIISYIPKIQNLTKNQKIEDLYLVEDSIYYMDQIRKAPEKLDLKRIKYKRARYYKKELEDLRHIKQYENWQRQGLDSITLKSREKLMLISENKRFQISYPIFSKNKKYALVLIDKTDMGRQLWILEQKKDTWQNVCVAYISIE